MTKKEEMEAIEQEVLHPTHCLITLDCQPGATRPDNLLPIILKDTGIKGCVTVSKFFGEYVFEVPKKFTPNFIKHEDLIIERIKALYHSGQIRYGGWSKP